jgi:small subunit ribosomal protein S4
MPRRKHKQYSRPRKMFDAVLIKSENDLIKKYGLKSRREVWRADYTIKRIRDLAKKLITADEEKQKEFIERLNSKGFSVSTIADVLALNKEDRLKRRLQSILVAKGLAKTHKQARQFITHKHVKIKGNVMSAPRHLATLEEESSVELSISLPEKKILSDEEKEIINAINKNSKEAEEEEKPAEAKA